MTARIRSAAVCGSGQSIRVLFEDLSSVISNISSFGTTLPTISVNGGAPVTLLSTNRAYETDQPWVWYWLGGTVLLNTDAVTLTTGADTFVCAAGTVAAVTALAIANLSGKEDFPAPAAGGKTMPVGVNTGLSAYYSAWPTYSNLLKQASGWPVAQALDANGYPTGTISGTVAVALTSQPTTGISYPQNVNGIYTLLFSSGSYSLTTGGNGTTVTAGSTTTWTDPDTAVVYTRIPYTVTAQAGANAPSVNLRCLTAGTAGSTDVRVYDPIVAPAGVLPVPIPLFHPTFTAKLAGMKVLRFLDHLGINNSNASQIGDFTQAANSCSYQGGAPPRSAVVNIASMSAYDNSSGPLEANKEYFRVVTSTPHGMQSGMVATIGSLVGIPGVTGTSNAANIGMSDSSSFNPNSAWTFHVIDATTVAFEGTGSATVVGTQTPGGTLAWYVQSQGMPYQDTVTLCNQVGADLWYQFPLLTPASVASTIGTYIAQHLNAGLKCYMELSNENWNNGFTQRKASVFLSGVAGLTQMQWLAYASNLLYAQVAAAFTAAGRKSDCRHVLAWQNAGDPSQMLSYAAAQGYPVHCYAAAPYWSLGNSDHATWESTYGPIADRITDPSVFLDAAALWLEYHPTTYITKVFAGNVAHARTYYPAIACVCYEGGAQTGPYSGNGATYGNVNSRYALQHPRMYPLYMRFLQKMQDAGCALYLEYRLGYQNGKFYFTSDALWDLYRGINSVAGRGDGSDGKYDNRNAFHYVSGVPTENANDLQSLVSVKGQALKDWNTLFSQPVCWPVVAGGKGFIATTARQTP